jgi:hypothetical protein
MDGRTGNCVDVRRHGYSHRTYLAYAFVMCACVQRISHAFQQTKNSIHFSNRFILAAYTRLCFVIAKMRTHKSQMKCIAIRSLVTVHQLQHPTDWPRYRRRPALNGPLLWQRLAVPHLRTKPVGRIMIDACLRRFPAHCRPCRLPPLSADALNGTHRLPVRSHLADSCHQPDFHHTPVCPFVSAVSSCTYHK